MKKFLLTIPLISVCILPAYAHSLQYTLQGAISRALQANPTIEEKEHALKRAQMNIGVAQSFFWPRASIVANKNFLRNSGSAGSVDELSSDTQSYGVRVALSLFSGFSHLNRLQQATIEKEIAELAKKQAELELIANVRIQYFLLLQAKRDLRLAKEAIKRIEIQLRSSEAFVSEDMAPYVNVLQNKVELARSKEQLVTAKNNFDSCQVQLNRFLGYAPDVKIIYKGELEDFEFRRQYDRNESIQKALKNRPDVSIAQKSIDAARKQALATAGEALPKVDLTYDNMNFDRNYRDSRYQDYDRQYWAVGINFTWTFFEGGRTVFGTLAEKRRADALSASYKNTVDNAKQEVIQSIMDIETSRKVFDTAKEGINAATESYSQAQFRYDQGVGTITELLDSQTKLTEAEVRCSKAMADYQISYAKYEYYIGGR